MPQHEVVTLPVRPGAAHSIAEIEKLAEAVARSRMFGITTKEQALVLMAIAQAEGRHPAEAARDYSIIQGKPSKTSEAMMRDFLHAGGRVEWHQLTDDAADATFSHPQGGTIRILWDTARAAKAGLASKDMWRKYPRQMMRSRCVSEGVRTVCPSATSGFYVPEEVRDMPATALPEGPSDTTADLDQFAAVAGDAEPPPEWDPIAEVIRASEHGADGFRAFWRTLSVADRERIKLHFGSDLDELKAIAKQADDPFGLPPLPVAETVMESIPSVLSNEPISPGARDVFAELDHAATAATKDGMNAWNHHWSTLSRADKALLGALRTKYEQLAADADAQRGLAL